MKIFSVATARSTWLFDLGDLNPKGKSLFPEIIDWLKDTYNFKETPDPATLPTAENKSGLPFKRGEFQAREEVFVDVEVTLFNDGLVANSSSSTEDTDKFLENLITTIATEYSLSFDPQIVRRRLYLSELNVKLDNPLSNLNPKLTQFAEKLSGMSRSVITSDFEVAGFSLMSDMTNAVYKVPGFAIERKVNAPFNENRFFTKAPLQTEEHISMLKELESLLVP